MKKNTYMVIGCARSGIATCQFLINKRFNVILTDTKNSEDLLKENPHLEGLLNHKLISTIFGRQPLEEEVKRVCEIVISPGIPLWIPPVKFAKKLNIKVKSEVELANEYCKGNIIAITGTNGKTTTTSLIGHIFKTAMQDTYVVGNIGDPFIAHCKKGNKNSIYSLEISSFQLELNDKLKPKVSIILNITPDHLDRHKTMNEYIKAKARVFENQDENDLLIANYDDEIVRAVSKNAKCRVMYYSSKEIIDGGVYYKSNTVYLNVKGNSIPVFKKSDISLYGLHNIENAMASLLAAYFMGISLQTIKLGISSFTAVEHRIERVRESNGVEYINDSKGTNSDATIIALKAMEKPVILIVGGYDKGTNFDTLFEEIKKKVKYLLVLGDTAEKIIRTALDIRFNNYIKVLDLKSAVEKAHSLAESGDVVLLSPACASWDMFDDYEQRGRLFKEYVNKL